MSKQTDRTNGAALEFDIQLLLPNVPEEGNNQGCVVDSFFYNAYNFLPVVRQN